MVESVEVKATGFRRRLYRGRERNKVLLVYRRKLYVPLEVED